MVSIEDFSKLDIRIGRIVGVHEIEKAKGPMYKLTINFGTEIGTRTIVAGIRDKYPKDALINKKIACIVNLEPKRVANVESQGMILAAGELEDDIAMLVPDKDIKEGTRIH